MAVIRDNRGALLASNISNYLAGAANTAGTPVDTNELVRIVNQFLGTGEQISSDITTITNGIYKKFGTIDKVTNRTEIVTSGIWSGDTGSLNLFFTSSEQQSGVSGKYYLDVYNVATSSDAAEVQFSIAYGDVNGYGAPTLQQTDTSNLPTKATYNQFKNVLLDSSDAFFSVYTGSTAGGHNLENFYVINVNRARYKERLDPGNFSITLSGSIGSLTLIDDSGGSDENVTTAGRVYNVVEGTLNIGSALTSSITTYSDPSGSGQGYGLFYPDRGIIVLNARAIGSTLGTIANQTIYTKDGTFIQSGSVSPSHLQTSEQFNQYRLLQAIQRGGDFEARRTENISTQHFFVRATNREFNYSNNPTYIDADGFFVESTFETDPQTYITTIGLYNDSNELIAVAKTSQPVVKSFDKEVLIKVKLSF